MTHWTRAAPRTATWQGIGSNGCEINYAVQMETLQACKQYAARIRLDLQMPENMIVAMAPGCTDSAAGAHDALDTCCSTDGHVAGHRIKWV